ncbi:hypothetical protein SteCoe_24811 [Stentor coeruleus]|uniref:Uncharacterized protein n=1 Tax=Stentor coeruleus TaxID=5963 RepID=A0A1R2BGK7_9CILI|nr:hypothetical protein SteCoe_24811 [Stentor coeruleus]
MSKSPIKPCRTVTEFSKFSLNNISETISSAFGNPIQVQRFQTANNRRSKKFSSLKTRQNGKDFFLTEANTNIVKTRGKSSEKSALTYEEMIMEIDNMTNGLKNKEDDLVELRRRIKKCQIGIEARETFYKGIHKSANAIESKSTALIKKFKSLSSLPKLRSGHK